MNKFSGYVLGFLVSTSVTAIAGFDYSQCTDLDEKRAHVERKTLQLKVYSRQLEGVIGQAVDRSGKLPAHMETLLHLKERLNKKLEGKQKLLQTLSEKKEDKSTTSSTESSKGRTADSLREEGQFWITSAQTLNTAGFKNSDDKLFGSWDLFQGYIDAHPTLKDSILPQNPATMDPTSYVKLVSNKLLTYENVLVYVQEKALRTTLKAIKLPLDQSAEVVAPTTVASSTPHILDENEIILRDIILRNNDIADKEKYREMASEMAKRGVKNLTPQELELAVKLRLPIIPIAFEGNEISENDLERKMSEIAKSTINDLDISGLYFFDASTLTRLANIETLNLSENQLTTVPESLTQLVNLTMLYLHDNKLTSIPEGIGQLTNLEHLHLHSNRLISVPESLWELRNLKHLQLCNNKLTSLSEGIGKLTKLLDLHLGRNQLTSVPEGILNLENLWYIQLCANQLKYLPEGFGRLKNLSEIVLYGNQLTSLPESIGKLIKLHTLHLSNNPLVSLPLSCEQLVNLKELVLYDTKVTQIPACLKKPTLKITGLGQV